MSERSCISCGLPAIVHRTHRIIRRGIARRLLAEKRQLYTDEVYAELVRMARPVAVVAEPRQPVVSSPQPVSAAHIRTSDSMPNLGNPVSWTSRLGLVWYVATSSIHVLLQRVRTDAVSIVRWMVDALVLANEEDGHLQAVQGSTW